MEGVRRRLWWDLVAVSVLLGSSESWKSRAAQPADPLFAQALTVILLIPYRAGRR